MGVCELHSWRGRRKHDSAKWGFWRERELLEFAEWFPILSGVSGSWVRDLSVEVEELSDKLHLSNIITRLRNLYQCYKHHKFG